MNLFFIADHQGKRHTYTAEEFYNLIMADAKRSHLNWHAPVEEIARVIGPFPKKYRDDICRKVLDCFAYFQAEHWISPSEQEAVWQCFILLEPDGNENDRVKEAYTNRLINKAIRCESVYKLHLGDSWGRFCQEYREEKQAEWSKLESWQEFMEWGEKLPGEFSERLKKAEDKDVFKEDDEKESRALARLIMNAVYPIL